MRSRRNTFLALVLIALAVVGWGLAQDTEAAVIVLPGSGGIGTGYTITLIGFAAGEDVSLTITGAANDEIYFQTTLTVGEDGSASTVIHSQRDDAPGEYLIQARVDDGASASASFQILSEDEAAQRAAPGPLYGESIAIDDGEWIGETTADAGVIAYDFTANAEDVLDAQLSSEVFDAYLVLLDADGAELAMDDDSGMDLNAHIAAYALPESGQYTLLATSWRFYHLGEASSVGEFQLDFQLQRNSDISPPAEESAPATNEADAEEPTSAAESGNEDQWETQISDALTEATPLMRYSFSGRAGQRISVRLRSDDFDPYLLIEDAAGDTVASDDDGDGGLNALLEDFTLPQDGTYSIVVSSWEHLHVDDALASGDFTLAVWGDAIEWHADDEESGQSAPTPEPEPEDQEAAAETETDAEETGAPAAVEETATPAPEENTEADEPADPIEIPISYGDRIALPITEDGQGLRYALAGQAGDRIDIAVASYSKLDTRIAVFSPDGALLAEDDDSGRGYNPELLGLHLPQDGTYIIVLAPVARGDGQPVSIAIDLREAIALGDGAISIKLNSKQSVEMVSLAAESAGEIRLSALIDGEASTMITIEATQGDISLASLQLSKLREIEWVLTVPEAGEIRLRFGSMGAGELSITLERVADDTDAETADTDE